MLISILGLPGFMSTKFCLFMYFEDIYHRLLFFSRGKFNRRAPAGGKEPASASGGIH